MGMFDTIYFDKKYSCPHCGSLIDSIQTKEFENVLDNYRVKDCVSHAEDLRIIKDELYCSKCRQDIGKKIYIIVGRGIFLGEADTLQEAKNIQSDLNLEKLLLWYHDLYGRLRDEEAEADSFKRFLRELCEWFGEGLHKKPAEEREKKLFILNRRHFEGAIGPLDAIHRFLTANCMKSALNELWAEGHETLDIYYPEDLKEGEDTWFADVYQDKMNERCNLNWTWTVINKKQLKESGENEKEQPEWVIVVDSPFSKDAVVEAIKGWLRDRRYEFEVRLIPPGEAKGSGLLKELKKRIKKAKKEKGIPAEEVFKRIDENIKKKTAEFVNAAIDKRKVFFYEGFYGSLVPDAASGKLVGKIEGIKETVIYEGKTIGECEEKFRKAVKLYQDKGG